MKQFVCYILCFGCGVAAGMLLPRIYVNKDHKEDISEKVDTLYFRDTITEIRPVFETEITVPDMAVVIEDSIIVKDDSLLVLPLQQRHYKGDDYELWISGYRPQLDSLRIFPETRYITKEITVQRNPKRWGIGIQAGYGVSLPEGRPQIAPYIGVGISYNLIRF